MMHLWWMVMSYSPAKFCIMQSRWLTYIFIWPMQISWLKIHIRAITFFLILQCNPMHLDGENNTRQFVVTNNVLHLPDGWMCDLYRDNANTYMHSLLELCITCMQVDTPLCFIFFKAFALYFVVFFSCCQIVWVGSKFDGPVLVREVVYLKLPFSRFLCMAGHPFFWFGKLIVGER